MPIISELKDILLKGAAVYAGEDFIDIAIADQAIKGPRVVFLKRIPLLKHVKTTPYREAKEEIDAILEKAFTESGKKPYRVAINLGNNIFILRHFTLPSVPQNELKQAIAFEAQKYVPYSIEELVYAFRTCGKKADIENIIFMAAEKKDVDAMVAYFNAKNIIPSTIESLPILVVRALGLEKKIDKDGVYLSLHYEPTNKVTMTGIAYRCPYFFKELSLLSGEEEFKTTELNYPSLKAIWPLVENEIANGIEYLLKETKKNVGKIFISGFMPSPDEEGIMKNLGASSERLDLPFVSCPDVQNKDRHLPVLTLLFDSMRTPFCNMAPEEAIHKDLWTFKPVAISAAAIFAGILILHLCFAITNASSAKKIRDLKKQYETYMAMKNATSEDVLRYKGALEDKAAFISGSVSRRINMSEKLARLSKDITRNSWLDAINYRNTIGDKAGPSLKINGGIYVEGAETFNANTLLENIKNDSAMMGGFKDAELTAVKKRKISEKEITDFEISLK